MTNKKKPFPGLTTEDLGRSELMKKNPEFFDDIAQIIDSIKLNNSDTENVRNILDKNYDKVHINKKNIKKYLDFVNYFDFDIKEQFFTHVFFKYTLKLELIFEECFSVFTNIINRLIYEKKIDNPKLALHLMNRFVIKKIEHTDFKISLNRGKISLLLYTNQIKIPKYNKNLKFNINECLLSSYRCKRDINSQIKIPYGVTYFKLIDDFSLGEIIFPRTVKRLLCDPGKYLNHVDRIEGRISKFITTLEIGASIRFAFILPDNLKKLVFDWNSVFNDKSLILNKGIKYVQFGRSLSEYIPIPDSVEYLEYGIYTKYLGPLAGNLKTLMLGRSSDLTIENLPDSLKVLKLSKYNKIDKIPPFLTHLILGISIPDDLIFSDTIIYLSKYGHFYGDVQLPPNLKYLVIERSNTLSSILRSPVYNLNKSLKRLEILEDYDAPLDLHEGIEYLRLPHNYKQKLKLPSTLKTLIISNAYKEDLVLNDGIETFIMLENNRDGFEIRKEQKITLRRSLRKLFIDRRFILNTKDFTYFSNMIEKTKEYARVL